MSHKMSMLCESGFILALSDREWDESENQKSGDIFKAEEGMSRAVYLALIF